MQPTRIGNFEVSRIADYEGPFFAPGEFFPDFDPAVVEEHAALLGPRLIEPGTGKLIFSFHSFVVKTGRHTILIDSCIGNDKERPTRPQFHRMKSSFIDDLARLAVKPEDIVYDPAKPLVIDPVLTYSTFFGAQSDDFGGGIATDSSGNIYIVGNTLAPDDSDLTDLQGTPAAT